MDTPREQFIAACVEVAESLLPLGFKFKRSGPHVERHEGEFTHRISFQSSRYNVSGNYVAFWVHASLLSKKLKDWQAIQAHPLLVNGVVAGGPIGNLFHPPRTFDWNVGGSSGTDNLADSITTIKSIVLPYFARFPEPSTVCALIQHEDLPSMQLSQVIEFLLCFADRATAEAAMRRFFKARPELLDDYHRYLAQLQRDGLPKARRTGYAYEMAFATISFGLTPPSPS